MRIREPDILDLIIIKPEAFIDAETLEALEKEAAYISLELKP